jgi:6-phosphogluconolactonase (cycloisomerase 2 family)
MLYKTWLGVMGGLVALAGCESTDGAETLAGGAGAIADVGKAGSSGGPASGGAGPASAGTAGASNVGGTEHVPIGGSGEGDHQGGGAGGHASGNGGATSDGGDGDGDGGDGGDGGSGGSGGDGGANGEAPPAVVYVSTVLGDLLVASLDPQSGAPSLLPSSPVDVAGFLHGVVVSPSRKFVFVPADPTRIDTYPIAADGSLPPEPSSSVIIDDEEPVLTMALDPMGRFAYGVSPFSKTIYAFTVDSATGTLTPSGDPLLVGPAPTHRMPAFVAPAPSGHYVYVTQNADGSPAAENGIRGYAVNQLTGVLTELAGSPFGGSRVFAGAIVFRPDGKFLYSSGAGLNAFAIDAESGGLTLVAGSPFSQDVASDPWAPNITIDPEGQLLYVSNFLQTRHISGFAIDATSGALEALPSPPVTATAPYSIALGPGGRYLYVGEDSGEIGVFSVARPSGALTKLDASPFPFGGLEPDFAFVTLH